MRSLEVHGVPVKLLKRASGAAAHPLQSMQRCAPRILSRLNPLHHLLGCVVVLSKEGILSSITDSNDPHEVQSKWHQEPAELRHILCNQVAKMCTKIP